MKFETQFLTRNDLNRNVPAAVSSDSNNKELVWSTSIHNNRVELVAFIARYHPIIPSLVDLEKRRILSQKKKRCFLTRKEELIELDGCLDAFLTSSPNNNPVNSIATHGKKLISKSHEAADLLVLANMDKLDRIAHEFRSFSLTSEDLVQEGFLGLVRAAYGVDSSFNVKFWTYAEHWARHFMTRHLAKMSHGFHVPVHFRNLIKKYWAIRNRIEESTGDIPSNEEMARELSVSQTKVELIRECSQSTLSINYQASDDKEEAECYLLKDEDRTADRSEQNLLDSAIEVLLNRLEKRERQVIELHFGINQDGAQTLDSIGVRLGVSKERVRQIQVRALRKLRRLGADLSGDLIHSLASM